MHLCFLLSELLLTEIVRSASVKVSKSCKQYSLPLQITSMDLKWALAPVTNNEEMAALNANSGRRDTSTAFHMASPSTGPETAVYTISGTFCEPNGGGNGTVLLASHGAGYDRTYWDPPIQPENYSFVDFAIKEGYSIFFYDRIGAGQSEHPSGYVLQISQQISIIKGLVDLIRSGHFSSPPSKVVLVGHSLGSIICNGAMNAYPDLADAAVLTGIAYNATTTLIISNQAKQLRLASLADPAKWGHLEGYTVWVDIFSNIENFFKVPFYDRAVVQWTEDTKVATGLLEGASLGGTNVTAPEFTGPVLVMSGEYDFIACGGYCPGIVDDLVHTVFPAAKDLLVYVQPNSGHSINLALNATGAFEVILNYLKGNGL